MAIWMAIRPGRTGTRVLATAGPREALLKANLAADPAHHRAVPALLEAVALWQGEQVRAVLCVGEQGDGYGTKLSRTLVDVVDPTPLFRLDIVGAHRRHRGRDRLDGLGDFRDLRQLLLFEVAR